MSATRSVILRLLAGTALISPVSAFAEDKNTAAVPEVVVTDTKLKSAPPEVQKYDLPNTTASITAKEIEEQINLIDAEDAVKYMPSLLVRKRNNGDTQPVLETRSWGVSSSARSLVYGDDILLTALIANDNGNGAPRWGLVAPEEIERIDMIYGPFAAEYPGNSMGGVLKLTTRWPERLEATVRQTEAFQDFSLYKTHDTYRTDQTSASVGDRIGKFAWFLSANHMRNFSQPLTFATTTASTTVPNFACTGSNLCSAGAIAAPNKVGLNAYVLGALGTLDTDMYNVKLKLGYDVAEDVRLAYTFGLWTNDSSTTPQTYLTSTAAATFGAPTYAGQSAFTGGMYNIYEQHSMHALSLKSDGKGAWDYEAVATHYGYDTDHQTQPATTLVGTFVTPSTSAGKLSLVGGGSNVQANAAQLTAFTPYGTLNSLDGTGWTTLDAKGIWRPGGKPGLEETGANELSFGVHGDFFKLKNPKYNVTNWQAGDSPAINPNALLAVSSWGQGQAETLGLWAQDAWKILPGVTATAGGRLEWWKTFGGYTASLTGAQTATTGLFANSGTKLATPVPGLPLRSPDSSSNADFSPKFSLNWDATPEWSVKGNYGIAYRFPTVFELYSNAVSQFSSPSSPVTIPNPFLKPERDHSYEVALEFHPNEDRKERLSLFWENDFNYIASQTIQQIINGQTGLYTYNQNVGEIRNRGIEFAFEERNVGKHVGLNGFDITGSMTYLDARIIQDGLIRATASLANHNAPGLISVIGKHVPNVPDWRATIALNYRPDEHWTFTVAGRYQSKMISTLDNADTNYNVYGGFGEFLVVDLRAHYELNENLSASLGIDNVNNNVYWLFHPFPQRSFLGDLHIKF